MKTLIFSDIHSNLEALEAIIADAATYEVERYICLGDVVGYYADPQACVDRIRELGILCIQGNHDAVASGAEDPIGFNPVAAEAIRWTAEQLDKDSRRWLAGLPIRIEFSNGFCGVHGSLRDRDEYLLSRLSVEANFNILQRRAIGHVAFFGHTHRRAVYAINNSMMQMEVGSSLSLNDGHYYFINPGGAGQPRDRTIGAPYAIVEGNEVQFKVAKYDNEKTAGKVRKLPFGDFLARRLLEGV